MTRDTGPTFCMCHLRSMIRDPAEGFITYLQADLTYVVLVMFVS